jgi:hypothetical protein
MPAQQIANLCLRRTRIAAQEAIQRHQNAGCAEPTLQRVVSAKRCLQDGQAVWSRGEAFDGA